MKTTYHIPTEQYGFIELEIAKDDKLTTEAIEEAINGYKAVSGTYKGESGEGLDQKTFNSALDEYLSTENLRGGTELYAKMSAVQQAVFQEIKKSLKRLKTREIYDNAENALSDLGR